MFTALLRLAFKALFKVEVAGKEHIPDDYKLLVVANHQSFLDGLLLGLFLPVSATFVVHTAVLKNPLFRAILKLVPHLAVDPTSPLAMKKVVKLLEGGCPVVIFPEGRITVTGSLMKVYDGPGFVAAKSGATVLPIRIDGAHRTFFSRLKKPREFFPKIKLTIQAPTSIPLAEGTAKARRRSAGDAMRRIMQNMMFAAQPARTLFQAFLDARALHGGGRRLVEDMLQVEESYDDILKKALALGRLTEKVTSPGETVGVLMPNLTNTVALIFGMSAMNRVPGLLNYTAGAAGIQNACIAANITTILTSRKFIETAKLEGVVGALTGLRVLYLEDLRPMFTLADKLWLMAYALPLPRLAEKAADPTAPAVVLFTSGSEGKPKGVVHSHSSILANIAQVSAVIDFSTDDKFMMALPLFHAFGFTCGAIMPLVTGSKLMLYPSPLHYRVIPEVIYDRGCTVLFGTSTFLGNYARFANPYDFYKLRYVVAGAEKLNDEVRKTWMDKFGIRILEGYGSTECAPVLAVNTPMAYQAGSVGQLLPGLMGKLEPVPGIKSGGRLVVAGPNVMLGYYLYDNPGVLDPSNGTYDTGDIVDIDDDKFVWIKGRVKRFAKIAGEMVSLETVEAIANVAAPAGQHAASTQPDANRGETIVLFTTDATLTREVLAVAAKKQGAPELAVAKKIVVVDAIPMLGSGKTDYVSLKRMADAC